MLETHRTDLAIIDAAGGGHTIPELCGALGRSRALVEKRLPGLVALGLIVGSREFREEDGKLVTVYASARNLGKNLAG